MARLIQRSNPFRAPVYDVTVEGTHSFFAASGPSPDKGVLVHNSHRLSTEALDALLKPLEDNLSGSDDKQLVCIFCTTEPEKMKATVLSRCAPAFVIQPQTPPQIAKRLQHICEQEGIEFEYDMLELIAEITECHIRDAIKAIEGVSMLGGVVEANVRSYLHLDLHAAYIDLLESLGSDLPGVFATAKKILERASPRTCYEKLAEVSMLAFRSSLGEKVPSYWGKKRLEALGASRGVGLLGYASRFASRPVQATGPMLLVDLAHLHHVGGSALESPATIQVQSAPAQAPVVVASAPLASQPVAVKKPPSGVLVLENTSGSGKIPEQDVLWVEAQQGPAAIRRLDVPKQRGRRSTALKPQQFSELLSRTLLELASGDGGRA